jgi:hypothetical protein
MVRWSLLISAAISLAGCSFLPKPAHQPRVQNPFPQLSRVAVAPFFNLTANPTVDGRHFALAYFHELQSVPGFEVVPVGVVESAMIDYGLALDNPETGAEDARRLAQLLGVDAIVVGSVTEFSAWPKPRCGLNVEWYAANPCFHPIPAGYGLPWGTTDEELIPGSLVYEAEMELAKAQLATQSPHFIPAPPPKLLPRAPAAEELPPPQDEPMPDDHEGVAVQMIDEIRAIGAAEKTDNTAASLPPDWPDPRGFQPAAPSPVRAACHPSDKPILQHVRTYDGHDGDFTTALETYVYFRDDGRPGDWRSYLERTDDFVRFCCHMHIYQMLSARGGAAETRVVWRWPDSR